MCTKPPNGQLLEHNKYLWIADVWFHVQRSPKLNLLINFPSRTPCTTKSLELHSENIRGFIYSELLQCPNFLSTVPTVVLVVTFQGLNSCKSVQGLCQGVGSHNFQT